MSSQTYDDLSELPKHTLIDLIIGLQRDSSPQNENVLHHRNRLLNEENTNFRKEIAELNSYKIQYYQLKTSIDDCNHTISQLKSQNSDLIHELQETQQSAARCHETEGTIHQLTQQNQSLTDELQHYKIAHAQYTDAEQQIHELHSQINALKAENNNLHEDLFRGERLHSTKYDAITDKLSKYQMKYNDLLQKYSSMESFVDEFCEYANESDDHDMNDTVVEQLTQWSTLLQNKQHHLDQEIAQTVDYQLTDIQHTLHRNQKEMASNIAESVLSDVICNVVTTCSNQRISRLHDMAETLSMDQNKIHSNKMLMESQITQLNGQKQIIANLNGTINDLCAKVKEYEHHIHRLTLQLKQLSLINQATQQTNTDFNVQQIQNLSHQLMEKEIELDAIKHQLEIKENAVTKSGDTIMEIQNALNLKSKQWRDVSHKYDHLKQECQRFNVEYSTLQQENERLNTQCVTESNAYRDLDTEYNLLKTKLELLQNQCNKLKQVEFNHKFKQQALKEQYQSEYDHFNKEYNNLQKKVEILEHTNCALQKEVDQYHSALMNHKEHYKTVNMKYTTLKYEYEKIQHTLKETEAQLKHVQQQSTGHPAVRTHEDGDQIQKLKEEIDRLQQQLREGSNIRRELRAFVGKCQREAQIKLNKSYKKLTFMKQLVRSTFRVLNEERQFVDKNNVLRQHLDYLRNTLHENQENHSQNI